MQSLSSKDVAEAERRALSERLQSALRRTQFAPKSATRLAREFNVRYPGRPITVHAARNWLVGESIPMQEKLRTPSSWLGLSATWLRYVDAPENMIAAGGKGDVGRIAPEYLSLVDTVRRLDEKHRQVVFSLARELLLAQGKKENRGSSPANYDAAS